MKKSLIALAALATVATAAQAQSSVEIYGVIDLGVGSISGVAADYTKTTSATTTSAAAYSGTAAGSATKNVTGLMNGGLSTSRLGFRGTEDLGGGLKAGFTLEAEFLGDNGSQKSTAESLFARESSVGLSGNFGAVKLGRFNTFAYGEGAKFDSMGGNNIGGYIASGNYGYVRIENAVQYVSPVFNGLTFGVQSGTRTASATYPGTTITNYGEVAGKTAGNRNTAAMVAYNKGPLELSASYGTQKDADGNKMDDVTAVFARYTIGSVRLVAGYMQKDIDRIAHTGTGSATIADTTTATVVKKTSNTFIGANYSISPKLTLNAIVQQIDNDLKNGTNQKPRIYAAGLNYSLSKRTTLYGIAAQSSQDNGSKQAIVNGGKWNYTDVASTPNDVAGAPAVADKNQTAWAVGVRHTF